MNKRMMGPRRAVKTGRQYKIRNYDQNKIREGNQQQRTYTNKYYNISYIIISSLLLE